MKNTKRDIVGRGFRGEGMFQEEPRLRSETSGLTCMNPLGACAFQRNGGTHEGGFAVPNLKSVRDKSHSGYSIWIEL